MKLNLLDTNREFDAVREIWKEMSARCTHSFFLSWGWMENWLALLPAEAKPLLAVYMQDNHPCAVFFIKKRNVRRRRIIKSRAWFVNAAGDPLYDRIWIEYNHFLVAPGMEDSVVDMLSGLPEPWDECVLPGLDMAMPPGCGLDDPGFPFGVIIEDDAPSYYVDLEKVRERNGDYISLLGSKTRAHVRRSYRFYEQKGPVALCAAGDISGALAMFDELVQLHEEKWHRRGQTGAFAGTYMRDFHKRLIQKRFDKGEIQLVKITAGDATVGCIYNFVYGKQAYNYQNGICYGEDKRVQPGFLSHVEAVKYNVAKGNAIYDFLAGTTGYKKSLSTDVRRLAWVRIQKPRLKFALENRLKSWKVRFWKRVKK